MLSVAIINYQTPDLTAGCVASIAAAPPAEEHEVVIVDNGSAPETLAPLRALTGVRLVETGVNGGFAAGVNRCLAEADARADVVAVLNSDTELETGALDALAAAARRDGTALAAPLLLERDGAIQRSAHRRFPTLRSTWLALCVPATYAALALERLGLRSDTLSLSEHEAGARPAHVMGAAMAFSRAAWEQVGPFDERFFMYLEETDWQQRARTRGLAVELVPAARVRHLHRGGDHAAIPPLFFLDSARVYFGERGHRDLTIRLTLASALLCSALAAALFAPLTRRRPALRELARASRGAAWRGALHLLRGRTVPRRPAG